MEVVHCPEEKQWISDVVNVRDFLNSWKGQLDKNEFKLDKFNFLDSSGKTDNSSSDIQSVLDEIYGAQALGVAGESELLSRRDITIPDDLDMLTTRLQKEDLEKRKTDPLYNSNIRYNFRHSNYPSTKMDPRPCVITSSRTVNDPEVVLSVQLFRPMSQSIRIVQKRSPLTFIVDQHMLVLGCQKLTEIRDCINCVSDITIPGDFSENPDYPQVNRAKDLYKSGFFYINGTFYNDMRDPSNRDYSEVITNWAKQPDRGIGPFKKKLMEGTRLIDLELRLGYPYLYMHQGNCEHLVVFTDLRLLDSTDSHDLNDYPFFQTVFAKRAVQCMICYNQVARWLTYNNDRLPCDSFFFCDNCFRSFNYTANGEKIGEFEAHPYFDRTAVV